MNIPHRQSSRLPATNGSLFYHGAYRNPANSNGALMSSNSIMTIASPAVRAPAVGKQLGREALRDLNDVFEALHANGQGGGTTHSGDRVDATVAEKAFERLIPDNRQRTAEQQPKIRTQYSTKEFRERFYNHEACQAIPVNADEVFELLDKDCNGFLEKDELKEALEGFGINITEEEARVMVALTGDEEEGLTRKSFSRIWNTLNGDSL